MKHRLPVFVTILALLCVMLLPARGEETGPAVNDVGLDLLGSSVHYPQLTGLEDEAVQAAVNAAIMEKGRINDRIARMAALLNAPVKLNVSYTYTLEGDIFSCAILADGAVQTSRATQVWSAVNVNLRTGEEITFADLFEDADAATAFIESYLEEQVAPDLSAHLAAGSLTPIPENFTISPTGLTLYYDIDDFRTLSDKAGAVTILWSELPALPERYPAAALHLTLDETSPARLTQALSGGAIPGVPAALGQSVQELADARGLLSDPDEYEGGRMISLEGSAFRQVWLLTDTLSSDYADSVVQGLRLDRMNLHGLCTGVTTQPDWRAVLGEPDATLTVDESRAENWRIVPGTSDYYTFGDYRLRLHADENGVLRSVFLMQ